MARILRLALCAAVAALCACGHAGKEAADRENDEAYRAHYRSVALVEQHARRALSLSGSYPAGGAEAMNHLAFASMARMDYALAERQLDSIDTDNYVELFVADVQRMRICQRLSRNKDFHTFMERAGRSYKRITEEPGGLSPRLERRVAYALSEMHIVASAYYYYVGLGGKSAEEIRRIDGVAVAADTAQWLSYLYSIGSGGVLQYPDKKLVAEEEFKHLARCYQIARDNHYPYFEAQALQGMSQALDAGVGRGTPAADYANTAGVPDSLLPVDMARRALDLFAGYGDAYQTAGAYRTIAESYWHMGEYGEAIVNLQNALDRDTAVYQAADLVASIREQLSMAFSAIGDKPASDRNRNAYLDLQEQTRQDRWMEARADTLAATSSKLNALIAAISAGLVLMAVGGVVAYRRGRRMDGENPAGKAAAAFRSWESGEKARLADLEERLAEMRETGEMERMRVERGRRAMMELKAKVRLAGNTAPLVNRMAREAAAIASAGTPGGDRVAYLADLAAEVERVNATLSSWIKMGGGAVGVRIETFDLQPLFDIVAKGAAAFSAGGVELRVYPTVARVKADRALTLFMVNTLADNARKATPPGGCVEVEAADGDGYVEISVSDNGSGIDRERLPGLFSAKPGTEGVWKGGFGLLNCKGIIDKYRKTSRAFAVCSISAESEPGKGSRFSFRIPKGLSAGAFTKATLAISALFAAVPGSANERAADFADSVYVCNVEGRFERALEFADSVAAEMNAAVPAVEKMSIGPCGGKPADMVWWERGEPLDYGVLLSVRNEAAVAALALHRWDLYRYNNDIYTRLFREMSADETLAEYCRLMQKSEHDKTVAIAVLAIMAVSLPAAMYHYYFKRRKRIAAERRWAGFVAGLLGEADGIRGKLDKLRAVAIDGFSTDTAAMEAAMEGYAVKEEGLLAAMEAAGERTARARYEADELHVAASVVENSLSALKHETMYYPARVARLASSELTEDGCAALSDLCEYYKELYATLTRQAGRQVERGGKMDGLMADYLMELLAGLSPIGKATVVGTEEQGGYVSVKVEIEGAAADEAEAVRMFTPHTSETAALVCSEIIREMARQWRTPGCGIRAEAEGGRLCVYVTVAKKQYGILWKSSRL